jgi:hypothetical protein
MRHARWLIDALALLALVVLVHLTGADMPWWFWVSTGRRQTDTRGSA